MLVRQIFEHSFTGKSQIWILVQRYVLVDKKEPLHWETGCPYVHLADEENDKRPFQILPVSCIVQPVYIVPDPRPIFAGYLFINWWMTFGENRYPEAHRWEMQQLWKWCELQTKK